MTSKDRSCLDLTEIKRQYKKASQKRYKRFGKYWVDRWMFQIAMWVVLAWLLFVANWYHFDLDYYRCDAGLDPHMEGAFPNLVEDCKNPFYRPASWKNQQYLPPGEYGTKLGPMFDSAFYVPVLAFAISIGLNHVISNGYVKGSRRKRRRDHD